MLNIVYTRTARNDLKGIYDYIAQDSAFYAEVFLDRLIKAVDRLGEFPQSGRIVPEINDPLVREVIYKSYRVMYYVDDSTVYVTQISHSAQDFHPER